MHKPHLAQSTILRNVFCEQSTIDREFNLPDDPLPPLHPANLVGKGDNMVSGFCLICILNGQHPTYIIFHLYIHKNSVPNLCSSIYSTTMLNTNRVRKKVLIECEDMRWSICDQLGVLMYPLPSHVCNTSGKMARDNLELRSFNI